MTGEDASVLCGGMILGRWSLFHCEVDTPAWVTLQLCAFHWHCLRYANCLFNNPFMPTSSVHIIDSRWGHRSSLDSLKDERFNWILLTHLLIWRILCAVLERYFCNRIPLQITRRPFCYSVSDRYRAFISANPMWKCSFDIVLISPNRHHRRNFFMRNCYLTPVSQHWCCKHWKHCYIDRDHTLFCYLVHGIPLMKSSKDDDFRFVRGTIGHRWIPPPPPPPPREPATLVYFLY